jgi:hypothetical protein
MHFADWMFCALLFSFLLSWVWLLTRSSTAAAHQVDEAATDSPYSERSEYLAAPSPGAAGPQSRPGRPRAPRQPEMLAVERRLECSIHGHKEASR